MKLSEHAVHSWDIAVALNPDETLAQEPVDLLIDTLAPMAGWSGKPVGQPVVAPITTHDPIRHLVVRAGEAVELERSTTPRARWPTGCCGCRPRRSSAWCTAASTRPTPRRSIPATSTSTSCGGCSRESDLGSSPGRLPGAGPRCGSRPLRGRRPGSWCSSLGRVRRSSRAGDEDLVAGGYRAQRFDDRAERFSAVAESTIRSGLTAATAPARPVSGVSGPRNVMRQPLRDSTKPKQIRPMSWRSFEGHASNARGPRPWSQSLAKARSRSRSNWLAKCS